MIKSNTKIIVVTGASGFIGRYCCKCLTNNGYRVISLGRSNTDDIYCDLTLPESLFELRKLPDYDSLIHLGAHVGWDGTSLENMYVPNIISTALIADIVRERGAHLLFASAAVIAGLKVEKISLSSPDNPDNSYTRSKLLAEQCIQASGVDANILRIGGVYGFAGPRHLGLNRVIQQALDGSAPVVYGSGSGKRNYIYVEDLALGILHAVRSRTVGTHLVSGTEVLTIGQMYQSVCEILNVESGPIFSPGDSSRSQIIEPSKYYQGESSFIDGLISIKRYASGASQKICE